MPITDKNGDLIGMISATGIFMAMEETGRRKGRLNESPPILMGGLFLYLLTASVKYPKKWTYAGRAPCIRPFFRNPSSSKMASFLLGAQMQVFSLACQAESVGRRIE